jgi:hypothetical protein
MDKNVNKQCFCNKLNKENGYQNVKQMYVLCNNFSILAKLILSLRGKPCDFLKLIKDSLIILRYVTLVQILDENIFTNL